MTPLTPEQQAKVHAMVNAAYDKAAEKVLAPFPPGVRDGVMDMCADFREYALYHVDRFVPQAEWQDQALVAFLTLLLNTVYVTRSAVHAVLREDGDKRSILQ